MAKMERTGNIFSISSSEFLVTFDDGSTMKVWSPPWHENDPETEERLALEWAMKEKAKARS